MILALYAGFVTFRAVRSEPAAQTQTADPGPKTQTEALSRVRLKARATIDREGELLARLARARTPQQITMICEQLGYAGGARAVLELKKLTGDRRYAVASSAQLALGRIGGPDAVDHLLALVDGTPSYAGSEAQALALTGDRRALDRLMELALEPNSVFQRNAIMALGEIGGPEVVRLFQGLLDDADPMLREAVVAALGSMEGQERDRLLIELAQSDDVQIRRLALNSLSDVSAEAALPLLLAAIEGDDLYSAQYAIQSLANRGDENAIQPILTALKNGSQQLRYTAVHALGTIGGPKAVKALSQLLQSSESNIPGFAASALISEGSPQALAAVAHAADAASGRRRIEFMQAMVGTRSPDIEAFFLRSASNADPDVRMQALQHLVQIRDPQAEALAVQAVEKGTPRERRAALHLLGSLGTAGARDALLDLAQGGGPDASSALVVMSERFSDAGLVDFMANRFQSGNHMDAQNAMYALVNSGDVRAREIFIQTLRGEDSDRAALAVQALSNFGVDDQTRAMLMNIARDSKDSALRNRALDVVLRSGSSDALRLASEFVNGSDPEVAVSALQSLYVSSDPRTVELVRSATNSKESTVRRQAAAMLGSQGASNIDLLEKLARDEDSMVAASALNGLAEIADDKSIDILIARSREEAGSEEAISALAQSSHPRAEARLLDLMASGSPAQAAAAMRVGNGSTPAFENAVREALHSKVPDIARAAAQNLRDRGLPLSSEERARIKSLLESEQAGAAHPNAEVTDLLEDG